MTHRTEHTGSSPIEAPRTATERRHTEAPRPIPDQPHDLSHGTDGTQLAAPGPDGHQARNRGPGDAGAPPASADRPAARPEVTSAGLPLLPAEEQDELTRRMRQAVSDFVESPRHAVEEAESTFDRIVAELTEALEDRRHVLRSSWRTGDAEARTEELRVALQQYRDVGEQLLRI
ncbi:hypothetical protein ACFWVP_03765 [Streptomyces sp. NPDC058637]|uniref:hypothetical protein n=1 Tax=Streptomyces sp. NPDC058637 TaxID=3346569 RepID=UPI003656D7BC